MSSEIDREDFTEADYTRFEHRLQSSVQALAELLRRPGFGEGPPTIGALADLTRATRRVAEGDKAEAWGDTVLSNRRFTCAVSPATADTSECTGATDTAISSSPRAGVEMAPHRSVHSNRFRIRPLAGNIRVIMGFAGKRQILR